MSDLPALTFEQRLAFLKKEYLPLLQQLKPGAPARWGKMDVQQMVEHMRDVFKVGNGHIQLPLMTEDPEHLEKLRAFIMKDKPFKENTISPAMPETPRPHKYASLEEAIQKLEPELAAVFTVYENDARLEIMNPIFGPLNYEQQIALLYKHAVHHLRQFGVIL
jgi:hypothetical protein